MAEKQSTAEEWETVSTPVNMEDELGEPSQDDMVTITSSQDKCSDLGELSSSQEPEGDVDNSVYCQLGFATIGRRDYLTLRPGMKINDEVINGVLHYLSRNIDWCHCFTTRFIKRYLETIGENQQDSAMSLGERRYEGVRRWTRGINLLDKAVVLFPIHWSDHWYLISVTNLRGCQTSITVLNSLEGIGNVAEAVAAVKEYLYHECSLTTFQLHVPEVPRQTSHNDCGIYTILYAQFLLQNLDNFQVPAPYSTPPPTCFDSLCFLLGEERQQHPGRLV